MEERIPAKDEAEGSSPSLDAISVLYCMLLPTVSVVVATYVRLTHIVKLVNSVRAAFPERARQIVVVSSDPRDSDKMKWLKDQPDVLTISADERQPGTGRTKSLYVYENMGLMACTGDWVIVVNDDMEFDPAFYTKFVPLEADYDVFMVKAHLAEVGRGPRTAVIGHFILPGGQQRPFYLYDFTAIRRSVYEKIGYLDEKIVWFGKGFDLALAIEPIPGVRVCYDADLTINHTITPESRNPPGCNADFDYITGKWKKKLEGTGWDFHVPY